MRAASNKIEKSSIQTHSASITPFIYLPKRHQYKGAPKFAVCLTIAQIIIGTKSSIRLAASPLHVCIHSLANLAHSTILSYIHSSPCERGKRNETRLVPSVYELQTDSISRTLTQANTNSFIYIYANWPPLLAFKSPRTSTARTASRPNNFLAQEKKRSWQHTEPRDLHSGDGFFWTCKKIPVRSKGKLSSAEQMKSFWIICGKKSMNFLVCRSNCSGGVEV